MTFGRLPVYCCKLAALNAFNLYDDPSARVPLFSVYKEMSPYFLAGEIEIFVEVYGEVNIRLAIAHHSSLI